MARFWVRVRAEYVVPVLATSREDALGLEPGDLCDDMTPDRLYHAEVIGAVPDSERQTYDCGAGLMLDAEQRAEHELDVVMLEVGAAVREHFQHVRGVAHDTFCAHVEDVIVGIADDIAREHIAEGEDDWQARRAALAAGIGRRAALSAKTYVKWRTENE
jgi:hypothetical protein